MPNFSDFISNIEASDLISEGESTILLPFKVEAGGIQGEAVSSATIRISVSAFGSHVNRGLINIPLVIQGRNTSIGLIQIPLAVEGQGEQRNRTNIPIRVSVQAEGKNLSNEGIIPLFFSVYALGNLNILYTLCEDKNNNL